jgi:hypothetical protein
MNDSLPEAGGNAPSSQTKAERRLRAAKPLPTNRMKMATQVDALKAITIASQYGERGVSALDIAPRLGLSPATAGLNNAFFLEVGLLVRERKGHYKPTEASINFTRKASFNEAQAAKILAPSFRDSWYYHEVAQQLGMGPATTKRMVEVLAHAAGATSDHTSQLESVLLWLEYVGLVVIADGHVQLGQHDLQDLEVPANELAAPDEPAEPKRAQPAASERKGTTIKAQRENGAAQAETVLSLNFDLALTADDLRKLTAEQITALFEAVGKVAAIKVAMQ